MTLSRIDAIVVILFSAIGIGIPTVIVLRHFMGVDLLAWLPVPGKVVAGSVFVFVSLLVCAWNFYLSFVNPWLHKRKHGNLNEFRSTSGLPVIGGIFIAFAATFMPASTALGVLLLSLYAMDGYGLPWILISVLRSEG